MTNVIRTNVTGERIIHLSADSLRRPSPHPDYQFLSNFQSLMTHLHDHEFYEFFYMIAGQVIHRINGAQQSLEAGDLVFVRPSDVHAYADLDHAECELVNIAFPYSIMDTLLAFLGDDFSLAILMNAPLSPVINLPGEARVHLMKRFNTLPALPDSQVNLVLRGFLMDVFTRYFSSAAPITTNQPDWLIEVQRAMQQPENFIIGYDALRDLCQRSQEHIARMFRQHLDTTPTDYINNLRLDYVANLLMHTDKPIVEIAMDAGFGNLSHFYHLFQRRFQMTPLYYRRTYGHLATMHL